MALFDAPGWDDGYTPVATVSSSKGKTNPKRKRGDDDTGDSANTASNVSNVNLQKLMRKMQLENANSGSKKSPASTTNGNSAAPNGRSKKKSSRMDPPPSARPLPSTQSHSSFNYSPPSKRAKIRREESDVLPPSSAGDEELEPAVVLNRIKSKKKSKKLRKVEHPKPTSSDAELEATDSTVSTSVPTHGWKAVEDDSSSSEFAGLTKLQREMKQKLSGGRFRMINELLYKSDSSSAREMMLKDPGVFSEYHTGFRNQVTSWPTNPVSHYTSVISSSRPPSTVIADLGCGDATLAKNLAPKGFRVLSFDLVSDGEWVIEADACEKLPLPGKEDQESAQIVDICVCALSLMNLNWIRCVREARRILKLGGELKIAEVTSRFNDVETFKSVICSLGFKFVSKEEPSTHFVLFEFCKAERTRPLSKKDWANVEVKAKDLLSPCEYKRR